MIGRIRLVVVVVAFAVLAGSGLAWAAGDTGEIGDPADSGDSGTLFTYGYDVANHLLVTGIYPVDAIDCSRDGTYDVGYGGAGNGTIPVETVAGTEPGDGEAPSGGDGDPCTLEAVVVAGPNGQVNHGQVVSAFSQALDIAGKGCVMRWIAKSGFGKGDQQVKTSDADPAFAPLNTGTIDLVTVMAACNGGTDDDAVADDDDEAAASELEHPGKPEKAKKDEAGKPDSPGNSANAPGHNK